MDNESERMTDLDTPMAVSEAAIEHYRAQGYVRLSGVLDAATLARHGAEITRLTLELNTQDKPLEERDTYDRAFLQVMNLWQSSEMVKQFVFGKRLASIAAALMGVDGVRLYHDQSLYKEPSGGITPAHADQYYWPLSSDRTITAWIPLQDTPLEMGPLEFYRGSHQSAFGRDLAISDDSEARISADMEAQGFPIDRAPFGLGDVSFHAGWTFHRAGANASVKPRSVMTIIYMDASIRAAQPVNEMQSGDLARWLPGMKPGDLAASPINPVLFETA